MMSSQLSRMILNGSTSTTDEMKAVPDENGFYDPIDGLLEEIAATSRTGSRAGDDRRPGRRSPTDSPVRVSRPS
jgi:hypothetical protein